MEKVYSCNHRKVEARCRLDWITPYRACQVVFSIWMAIWLALIPVPGFASQALHPPSAISAAGQDHAGPPPPDAPGPDEPQPEVSATLYLPDLRTLPVFDLHIRLLPNNRRSLRLANTIWNSGSGPLELSGEFNAATHRTRVVQHIHSAAGDKHEILVGEFVWHSTHDHWHFDEFTLYELWTLESDHSLGQVVASSDKLSYCVIDTDVIDRDIPNFSPRRNYANCGQNRQGLSVGWGDTYKSFLDGQSLDLTGLPDGFYALTSRVNPNGVILEADYSNNSTRAYLALLGDRLIVLSLHQIKAAECGPTRCI
jgi:hypothetical protein